MNEEKEHEEQRSHKRYNTEIEVFFDFEYDIETKIKFDVIDKSKDKSISKKYHAVSRNISASGLSFVTHKDVKPGDYLHMELYLPSTRKPIHMKGEVRWHKAAEDSYEHYGLREDVHEDIFQIGVHLTYVNDEPVDKSVHFDKEYAVNWSVVLEEVFGSYKTMMSKKMKKRKK